MATAPLEQMSRAGSSSRPDCTGIRAVAFFAGPFLLYRPTALSARRAGTAALCYVWRHRLTAQQHQHSESQTALARVPCRFTPPTQSPAKWRSARRWRPVVAGAACARPVSRVERGGRGSQRTVERTSIRAKSLWKWADFAILSYAVASLLGSRRRRSPPAARPPMTGLGVLEVGDRWRWWLWPEEHGELQEWRGLDTRREWWSAGLAVTGDGTLRPPGGVRPASWRRDIG